MNMTSWVMPTLRLGEEAQVEDGMLDGEFAPEEEDQPDDGDDGAG